MISLVFVEIIESRFIFFGLVELIRLKHVISHWFIDIIHFVVDKEYETPNF